MTQHAELVEGLWEEEDGTVRLRCGRCVACDRLHFPLARWCPHCGAEDPVPELLGQGAVLWAWTEVATAPPGYEGPVPFGFGVVELPEGLRVVTRLEGDVAAFAEGTAMRPTLAPCGDDKVVYAFERDSERRS